MHQVTGTGLHGAPAQLASVVDSGPGTGLRSGRGMLMAVLVLYVQTPGREPVDGEPST